MRILAIDDEFAALSLLVAIFSEYGACDAATNGHQALDMYHQAFLSETPYDLIVVDIQMPEVDGLEVLKKIVHSEKYSGAKPAKKIVISADSSPHNVCMAGKFKCEAFLVKPVRRDALMAKLDGMGYVRLSEPHET